MQSTCININPTIHRTFSIGNDPVSPPPLPPTHTHEQIFYELRSILKTVGIVRSKWYTYLLIAMHLNKRTMKKIAILHMTALL